MPKPDSAWQTVVLRVHYDPTSGVSEPGSWNWTEMVDEEIVVVSRGDVTIPSEAHGGRDLMVRSGDLEYMTEDEYDDYLDRRNTQLMSYDRNVKEFLEKAEREGVGSAGSFPGFPHVYTTPHGTVQHLTETPSAGL